MSLKCTFGALMIRRMTSLASKNWKACGMNGGEEVDFDQREQAARNYGGMAETGRGHGANFSPEIMPFFLSLSFHSIAGNAWCSSIETRPSTRFEIAEHRFLLNSRCVWLKFLEMVRHFWKVFVSKKKFFLRGNETVKNNEHLKTII